MAELTFEQIMKAGRELAISLDKEFRAYSESGLSWAPYQGEQGGKGWKNSSTGEIRYQTEKPADDISSPSGNAQSKPASAPVDPRKQLKQAQSILKGQKVNPDGKKAVMIYAGTNDHFRAINGGLRAGNVPEQYAPTVESLKAAIAQNPLRESIVSYRGLNTDDELSFEPGQEIQDKGFISTSINRNIADIWSHNQLKPHKTVFEISLPKGTPALYASGIDKRSNQDELVLSPGSKFRVKSVEEQGEYALGANKFKYRVVKLEYVG